MWILNLKTVPDSPDRLYILGLSRIEFDLLPDLLDMHRHGRDITDGFHIPDLPEQFFFCEHPVGILSQECEQVEFFRRKVLLFSVDPDTAGCLVDLDPPYLHNVILGHPASDQPVVPGQMSLYAGHHLTGRERFRNPGNGKINESGKN